MQCHLAERPEAPKAADTCRAMPRCMAARAVPGWATRTPATVTEPMPTVPVWKPRSARGVDLVGWKRTGGAGIKPAFHSSTATVSVGWAPEESQNLMRSTRSRNSFMPSRSLGMGSYVPTCTKGVLIALRQIIKWHHTHVFNGLSLSLGARISGNNAVEWLVLAAKASQAKLCHHSGKKVRLRK